MRPADDERHGLVVFGSPAAGTAVIVAAPLVALDLPLKILVWTDSDQDVWVSYNDPGCLAARCGLPRRLAGRLAGVGPLVDAAVAV